MRRVLTPGLREGLGGRGAGGDGVVLPVFAWGCRRCLGPAAAGLASVDRAVQGLLLPSDWCVLLCFFSRDLGEEGAAGTPPSSRSSPV